MASFSSGHRGFSRLPVAQRRTAEDFMFDWFELDDSQCLPDDIWRHVVQQLEALYKAASPPLAGPHVPECRKFSYMLRDVASLAQTSRAMSNAAIVAYAHLSTLAAAAGLFRCVQLPADLADGLSFAAVVSGARDLRLVHVKYRCDVLHIDTSGSESELRGRVLRDGFGLETPVPAPAQLVYWLHRHSQAGWELECDTGPLAPLPDLQPYRSGISVQERRARFLWVSLSMFICDWRSLLKVPAWCMALLRWAALGADFPWPEYPAEHMSVAWWSLFFLQLLIVLCSGYIWLWAYFGP